jgi:hypothetical protein
MEQRQTRAARLLPKELWSTCPRCGTEVPEFELSQQFQSQLADLIESGGGRTRASIELRDASGCKLEEPKAWVGHKTYSPPEQDITMQRNATRKRFPSPSSKTGYKKVSQNRSATRRAASFKTMVY